MKVYDVVKLQDKTLKQYRKEKISSRKDLLIKKFEILCNLENIMLELLK